MTSASIECCPYNQGTENAACRLQLCDPELLAFLLQYTEYSDPMQLQSGDHELFLFGSHGFAANKTIANWRPAKAGTLSG